MNSLSAKHQTLADRLPALNAWYESDTGAHVWAHEEKLLPRYLQRLFGYHLLSLGICPQLQPALANISPINHQLVFSPSLNNTASSTYASFQQLPLASETIDVAVLHHCLDYSEDPHCVLREAARVLIPYGHVLVFGFQRWSALGLAGALSWRKNAVAKHDFIGMSRLHDWLKLLDFDVLESCHTAFMPPQWSDKTLARLQWLESAAAQTSLPLGCIYCVLAQKTVAGMRPIIATAQHEKIAAHHLAAALTPQAASQHQQRTMPKREYPPPRAAL